MRSDASVLSHGQRRVTVAFGLVLAFACPSLTVSSVVLIYPLAMSDKPEDLLMQAEELAKTDPKRAEQIYNQILGTCLVFDTTLILTVYRRRA